MTIKTVVHLNFRGNAREALAFYHAVFGGDLVVVTYADAHAAADPAQADQVIWGQVLSRDGFHVMAFDVQSSKAWSAGENPFYVSIGGDDAETLTRYWERLGEGGTVLEPLGVSGFSPLYGMVKDAFGITWVLALQVAYDPA
jgi:PhnB protein